MFKKRALLLSEILLIAAGAALAQQPGGTLRGRLPTAPAP